MATTPPAGRLRCQPGVSWSSVIYSAPWRCNFLNRKDSAVTTQMPGQFQNVTGRAHQPASVAVVKRLPSFNPWGPDSKRSLGAPHRLGRIPNSKKVQAIALHTEKAGAGRQWGTHVTPGLSGRGTGACRRVTRANRSQPRRVRAECPLWFPRLGTWGRAQGTASHARQPKLPVKLNI